MRSSIARLLLGGGALILACGGAQAAGLPYSLLEKGKQLVDAGDCQACHTQDKSKPFAGGRAVPTPFGTIYSANITPDRDTGIGGWTADDFYKAMHEGVGPHGERLYPAFPYPNFTKMTRADVDAVRAYLMSLTPIQSRPPGNELMWPLNYRIMMAGWNMLFFTPGEYRPDPQKSAVWNRGAYLVQGAGHCGACHTPKNVFGADKSGEDLRGAQIQDWTAPSLAANERDGLGRWSNEDIVEYLKTGRNKLSGATGLMAEVVVNSTSKMSDEDLKAIATYLKDTPPAPDSKPGAPSQEVVDAGKGIYNDSCAACHEASGAGVPHMFPPLKGNAVAQQADPSTVVRVILEGAMTAATKERPTPSAMPAFAWKLSNDEIAAVATYVRNAWGNQASPVSASDVSKMRKSINAEKAGPQIAGSGIKMNER
jgi:mono/diheme cytochrome c family protein